MAAPNDVQIVTIPKDSADQNQCNLSAVPEVEEFDYSKRAQWLRAAVLGANDGLVSIASLMMGVGAVKDDVKVMILTGFAGLFAGACSMAIGEFVSVYSQLDIEAGGRGGGNHRGIGGVWWCRGGAGEDEGGEVCGRVVVGGWMAMGITFGLTKLLSSRGLEM
ncbi:UNVERIFIED_CONTAM: Vacuolar iron transporter1 [Sesamum latifolium]|uniref:Vacuolar iron transporter n=1 Tax=Sesamum latifolium TaxID=2727402 RepID=A0AAW2XMK7_9LAMI